MSRSLSAKLWFLAAAFVVLQGLPARADFVIDNFDFPAAGGTQGQLASVSGGPGASAQNTVVGLGANTIGGTRTIYVDNGSSGGNASVVVNQAFPVINNGRLVFSQDTAVTGNARVTWDGDPINGLSGNGFAPQDITEGGVDIFLRVAAGADIVGTNVTITFYTDDGSVDGVMNNPTKSITFTIPTPQNPLTTFLLPFAAFTGTGDLTKVVAGELFIDGSTSADVSIDLVGTAPAPEPTTLALGCMGLLSLGGYVLRRRAVAQS